MRLYISGPMTGLPGLNYRAFNDAELALKKAGYETSNPAQYIPKDGEKWEDCLRRDLHDVLNSHGVALLPGYESSRGAQLEIYVAHALSMPVYDLSLWLTTNPAGWDKQYVKR